MNLSRAVKVTRASNAVAAGVGAVNGAVIDMQDFEGVMFAVAFGAIVPGAVTSVKLQGGSAADGSDMADLAGTGIAVADNADNAMALVECYQPQTRYVRVVISRATQNSTVDCITATLYSPRVKPTSQDATVCGTGFTQSPDAGNP